MNRHHTKTKERLRMDTKKITPTNGSVQPMAPMTKGERADLWSSRR